MKVSKKIIFYLFTGLNFIYSGIIFFTVKQFHEQIKNILGNHNFFIMAMTALFFILAVTSGVKLNELRHEAEKDPFKALNVVYHVLYTTFLFATLYFLFNSVVFSIIPVSLANILTFCDIRLNIPISILIAGFLLKKQGKTAFLKKLPVYAVASAIIIFELTISDIIMLVLMLGINKMNLLKSEHKILEKITAIAIIVAVILTLSMTISGETLISAVSAALTFIVFLNEKDYITGLFNFKKGVANYET